MPRCAQRAPRAVTSADLTAWIATVDPGAIRAQTGFSPATLAEACGTGTARIRQWENGAEPHGPAGVRYARIIAGLARHLDIPEERP